MNVDAKSHQYSEVITETGKILGWVRKFRFNVESGQISSFIIATLAIPWIPDQLLSTYELSFNEIVNAEPRKLIVFGGAEDRLNQLTIGFLERFGLDNPLWEEDLYIPSAPGSWGDEGDNSSGPPPIPNPLKPGPRPGTSERAEVTPRF